MRIGVRQRVWRKVRAQVEASGRVWMLSPGQEFKSPLGHSLTPAFPQVRSLGSSAVGAPEALVTPA
jgi:hypothetical protein